MRNAELRRAAGTEVQRTVLRQNECTEVYSKVLRFQSTIDEYVVNEFTFSEFYVSAVNQWNRAERHSCGFF